MQKLSNQRREGGLIVVVLFRRDHSLENGMEENYLLSIIVMSDMDAILVEINLCRPI